MQSLYITASSLVNSLGIGKNNTLKALQNNTSGLKKAEFDWLDFQTFVGEVPQINEIQLENKLKEFDCRNNRIAKLALDSENFRQIIELAKKKYGKDRIGVFVGTSTSGMTKLEKYYADKNLTNPNMLKTHNVNSSVNYIMQSLGVDGVSLAISTACSSSAKVFASASRYLALGLCDCAIVGGVDSLCQTTLYGFNSLQLISPDICKPYDKNRQGINIGEAAGFMLLEKSPELVTENRCVKFSGYGESSDAYHISSPHPSGNGARDAMNKALISAKITSNEVDYINLHGTATKSNDKSEASGVLQVFNDIDCSSTKGLIGHTLGAAGISEAIICELAIKYNIVPANTNLQKLDKELGLNISNKNKNKKINMRCLIHLVFVVVAM